MTVSTNNYQIGVSGIASQNFHLTTPAIPDGSLKLYRGNAGAPIGSAIVDISAAGDVSWPGDPAWVSLALTPVPAGGAFTSASATLRYRKIGRVVVYNLAIVIVTNGTASGAISVAGLPFPVAVNTATCGVDLGVSGRTLSGRLFGGSSSIGSIVNYDNTYPGANGAYLSLSGVYEATS